jgi:glutamate synthase (NADPH) small chain
MGKPTGFVEWERIGAPKRPKHERTGDFAEFTLARPTEVSRAQAGRCMDCGVPFCQQGCPLGNPIPDFNEHVFGDRWKQAFLSLSSTNNFPEFTGRLCPAPCEAACVLGIDRDPVTIEQMEKEIIERAFAEGWVKPQPPSSRTGKRVAVVGSGPAGLAAAAQLNRAGHSVTVFERDDAPGGLLRYGIPDFKMERSVLDRRLAILQAEGIEFRCGIDAGASTDFEALKAEHDAVVLCLGARKPRELDVPGRELAGVVQAMEFLEAQNRALRTGKAVDARLSASGKRVVILGGGDTGSDCLGTAHRQGAHSVVQAELLPEPPRARTSANPWPQWPMVFRTSSSQEEGGERAFGFRTRGFAAHGGKLTELLAERVSDGAEVTLNADLVLLALGFTGPETQGLGVALDHRGNVAIDAGHATSVPGVWAAGDVHRGASLIVWAIADGREAAHHVDAALRRGRSVLATRGQDAHFGGR